MFLYRNRVRSSCHASRHVHVRNFPLERFVLIPENNEIPCGSCDRRTETRFTAMFKQKLGENHAIAYFLKLCMFEIPESEKFREENIYFPARLLSFTEVQLSGRVV